ncbi:retrovirus-related pol polyprotein from transposon TNT 1-94 [Tanacetum coccineum]
MQQPIPNPEDITDPTTAMNMALALMAKAFKLNYSTTNTNFIKPSNLADAQPVQNVGNQVVQDAVQNQNGQIGVQNIGNGNVVAARAEGTVQSRQEKDACVSSTPVLMLKRKKQESNLQAEEFDLMAAAADLDEIEEVGSLSLKRTLVEAARTRLIFSRAPLFLWAEAIATVCYTQTCSIIHRRFNKTPYKLINGRKSDISFLHVFEALYYPKNDHDDIGKLGANGDIGFFIGYSTNSCADRVYNRRTKKTMETMNVTFDELSAMALNKAVQNPGFKA